MGKHCKKLGTISSQVSNELKDVYMVKVLQARAFMIDETFMTFLIQDIDPIQKNLKVSFIRSTYLFTYSSLVNVCKTCDVFVHCAAVYVRVFPEVSFHYQ